MDKALLDTDTLSELLKGRDTGVQARAKEYLALFGVYTISIITVMEIIKGFHKVRREDRVQQILTAVTRLEILTLDVPTAELAGRILADLERTGQPIGRADPMIAAIALRHDLSLTTGNTEHYQRIIHLGYHLKLNNWRNSA